MKKILLSFTFLLACFAGFAQEVPQNVLDAGLKVVSIVTVNSEEPTAESIAAPEGSWGVGITNVNKVPGRLKIFSPSGDVLYDSGDYEKKESGMTIKVRGNTSARFPKKPFKIKLEMKADLLGRGDNDLRDKNWALLQDRDQLLVAGYNIGEWIGMHWAPSYEWVNVVINGDYRGLYLLSETVERNETARIRTEETGFIAERDPYWWNENGEYINSCWNPQFNWTMKYPDFEDLEPAQTEYIQGVLNNFEEIINTEDYEKMIDVDSFCRWVLAQDILGTIDGGGTNFFIAKNDDTDESKLFVPVLWDVDSALDAEGAWSAVHREKMISPLFENENKAFLIHYISLYDQYAEEIFDKWQQEIDGYLTPAWDAFNRSSEMNNVRWPDGSDRIQDSASDNSYIGEWIETRRVWLKNAVDELKEGVDTVEISPVEEEDLGMSVINGVLVVRTAASSMQVYTADGRLLYSGAQTDLQLPAKGLYVVKVGNKNRKLIY